ncbi:hypothetical protein [Actinocorallia sp. A-T 12471]|uniref:hypothetical protein n=1 Tax=Actinocorallia sp. A-T 12471 TaxID=3089813 RepID=UPI0029CB7F95|nr:hypothetical protein [Actinocorallia sp. A-T 12471]MDX6740941.1 hypothetical protein [Actinocorallia sp. A-T 12471]
MHEDTVNEKVYIHEFINITKQHRARYMHHMTANWSPIAQEQRGQLCYGVWGVVGSTGPWPQVVNLWEEDGFAGLAASFRLEFGNKILQDPALEKWWAAAADLRSGGFDRIVVPHPGNAAIGALCADGPVGAEVYAHEIIGVPQGGAWKAADLVAAHADAARARTGWRLLGAFVTAMHALDEVILLWAIPDWEAWAAAEEEAIRGRDGLLPEGTGLLNRDRILLVDAPLSPLRTGRQPHRDDRTDWTD